MASTSPTTGTPVNQVDNSGHHHQDEEISLEDEALMESKCCWTVASQYHLNSWRLRSRITWIDRFGQHKKRQSDKNDFAFIKNDDNSGGIHHHLHHQSLPIITGASPSNESDFISTQHHKEADSPTITRHSHWNWTISSINTRLPPGASLHGETLFFKLWKFCQFGLLTIRDNINT